MTTVIKVENLGKKYLIGHEKQARYSTLRDSLSHGVKSITRRIRHPLQANTEETELEEFWALRDINFEIKQGDKVGIIGRNGAGKSTLLKILSRITAPTTGKITLKGRVASLLEVGTGFHPELSGRENIYLNGAILGMRKAEIKQKFDEIVAFAEVEKFLDTPVKRYSSGMYVRLAFAVAAHLEPEILVVDEVLAVGDAQFQKKCLGKMEEVSQEGRTILFVSHNMAAIQNLCTKAIQIKDGIVVSQGSVSDQMETYLKDIQKKKSIVYSSNIWCGPDIQLMRLEFSPNPVNSKGRIYFLIELLSKHTISINALVILIYSISGERIAILDLRQGDGTYKLNNDNPFVLEGKIPSIPLVDGAYSIGLYIDYGAYKKNMFDLIELTVSSPKRNCDFSPFPPNVRGIVDLDFSIAQLGPIRLT